MYYNYIALKANEIAKEDRDKLQLMNKYAMI